MYAAWVGGTALGLAGAGLIEDPRRFGLDAAFCAVFLAVLTLQLRTRRALARRARGGRGGPRARAGRPAGRPIVAAAAVALAGGRGVSDPWLLVG